MMTQVALLARPDSNARKSSKKEWKSPTKMSLLVILIILILVFGVGGNFYGGGTYRNGGFGLAGLVLVVLLIMFFTGSIRL
jgi:hypothetical protein